MFGLGTIINVLAILVGGIIGLSAKHQISASAQSKLKALLVMFVVLVGAKMMWSGISGSFTHVLKQFGIMMLGVMLGNILGKLLRIQKMLNRLGQYAAERFQRAQTGQHNQAGEGFVTCSLLFCVGPMAVLGAVQDGLMGDYRTLAIKAAMDGIATMTFASVFGWGVLLSVIPVLAYQGTITLLASRAAQLPYFQEPAILDSINLTGGMLIFCLPLIILEMRKVPLADYLPALLVSPMLTWWWLH